MIKPNKKKHSKRIIGRTDIVDFPDLELFNIDAKIDTGAFGSAIHCHNIEIVTRKDKTYLKFNLLDPSHEEYVDKDFLISNFSTKVVKNSFGQEEERFVFKAKILLFGKLFKTEFSLSDRGKMRYPVLLGRKLLYGNFIVDVTRYNISYNKKQKKSLGYTQEIQPDI